MDSVVRKCVQIIFRIAMLVGGTETTVAAEVAAEGPGNRGFPDSASEVRPQLQMAERRNCLQRRPAFRPLTVPFPLCNNYTPTFFIFPSTLLF